MGRGTQGITQDLKIGGDSEKLWNVVAQKCHFAIKSWEFAP